MEHYWTVDGAALAALAGVMWGAIPTFVSLLVGVYYCMLIYQAIKHRRVSHAPEASHDGS